MPYAVDSSTFNWWLSFAPKHLSFYLDSTWALAARTRFGFRGGAISCYYVCEGGALVVGGALIAVIDV